MKIGAVSYLNTKPLIEHWSGLANDELILDLPSRLADRLKDGSLDLGLIPAVEVFQQPEFLIVPDACIACSGPVWSVKLMSRVPMDKIRSLALDEGSRTSAVLAQILLFHLHHVRPEKFPLPIQQDWTTVPTDAVVIIGDRAMAAQHPAFPHEWDLGQVWNQWTGLPFVFAVWASRKDLADHQPTELDRVQNQLNQARDLGKSDLSDIANRYARQYGLTFEDCHKYLSYYLSFDFGAQQRQALERFHQLTIDLAFAPQQRELTYHEC